MRKLTMHDEIKAVLIAETDELHPTTQPQVTRRLRFPKELGSRSLVLNELQEKTPHVHRREILPGERKPAHGRAKLFWWWDESKHNDVFGRPKPVPPLATCGKSDLTRIQARLHPAFTRTMLVFAAGALGNEKLREELGSQELSTFYDGMVAAGALESNPYWPDRTK